MSGAAVEACGLAHKAALWLKFRKTMWGNDISEWLHQGPTSTYRQADLCYFMGERIASASHAKAPDRHKALQVRLRAGVAGKVVRRSGYRLSSPDR